MPYVLFIDDEPAVCVAFVRYVEVAFQGKIATVTARRRGDALAFLTSPSGSEVALIICDYEIVEPNRTRHDCQDLIRDMLAIRPELLGRVAICTGAILSPDEEEFVNAMGCFRLEKPFELEDLNALIVQVTDG